MPPRCRRLPPAIRPGLHCGQRNAWVEGTLVAYASPGHQAGAPLRRRRLMPLVEQGEPSPGHQAGAPLRRSSIDDEGSRLARASPGHQAGAPLRHRERGNPFGCFLGFPRPSGRGSIAAPSIHTMRSFTLVLPPAIRPGLHCGRINMPTGVSSWAWLPPAIRPGLHCGVAVAGWPLEPDVSLPPAIRPGLHCGTNIVAGNNAASYPSPGHQAGAPLRLPVSACLDVLAPRSSPGHQAGAPLRLLPVPVTEVVGRASPGHQAGAPLRQPRCRMGDELGVAPSPGHQAGAPLRLPRPHVRDRPAQVLPPAIRPGLHCGPGVGIVAPDSCVTSPGHQAGAPLRHRVDGVPPSQWVHFPRPSGRGSIAASSSVNHHHRDSWLPPAIRPGLHCGRAIETVAVIPASPFPRPSGRGSIAARWGT